MVPLSMTLSDLWPGFQGHDIFLKSNIRRMARLKSDCYYCTRGNYSLHMEWYYVWWPWLTSKRVARLCQHQLCFLFIDSQGSYWCIVTVVIVVVIDLLFITCCCCRNVGRCLLVSWSVWRMKWGIFTRLESVHWMSVWMRFERSLDNVQFVLVNHCILLS